MNLKNIVVVSINNVFTVYSEKGRCDKINKRSSYGLSLCSEGQITYVQNGEKYVSNKDCAVILPKGGTYFVQGDKTGLFPVINFNCLGFLSDTVVVIPVQNTEALLADYERLKKLYYFGKDRMKMFSIFYGILSKLCFDNTPYYLKGALNMIESDFCDPSITNAKLAERCNMSEVYFRKLFTEHFGNSPKQFIIDLRIQKAKQLLSEGVLSISLISESCGFSNPYHFCRIFKQHAGITPSRFREENVIYGL